MANPLMFETIWFDRYKYEDAFYYEQERLAQTTVQCAVETSSLVGEIAKARQQIKETLSSGDADKGTSHSNLSTDAVSRIEKLEKKYEDLHKIVSNLERRLASLEETPQATVAPVAASKVAEAAEVVEKDDEKADDEDDVDLFGSDEEEETEEQIRQREERVRAYEEKKAKKPGVVAKSNIILFVKPWDDETDMKEMERLVRSLETDGLLWGASKLVPVGYGINKLQISCVVEDDKVGTDWLEENITEFEDHVQSVDIAAFNKI